MASAPKTKLLISHLVIPNENKPAKKIQQPIWAFTYKYADNQTQRFYILPPEKNLPVLFNSMTNLSVFLALHTEAKKMEEQREISMLQKINREKEIISILRYLIRLGSSIRSC